MKILVTGATGFVGGHLCEYLNQKGHSVYALARNQKKFLDHKIQGQLILGDLSLSQDLDWVQKLPSDLEAVVHAAGLVHSFHACNFEEINFLATQRLIVALKGPFPHLKFLFISSQAACGPSQQKERLSENCPLNPVSDYGLSKKKAEESLWREAPETWRANILRPPIIMGPRDPAFLPLFRMVKKGPIPVSFPGGGSKKYSFICVYDLVEVILRILEDSALKKEIFFACYDEDVTFSQIVRTIHKLMRKKILIFLPIPFFILWGLAYFFKGLHFISHKDFPLTPDKVKDIRPNLWAISGEKSKKRLGMAYQWDLLQTAKCTLQDYQNRNLL